MILNQEFFPGTAVDGSPLTWEVFSKALQGEKTSGEKWWFTMAMKVKDHLRASEQSKV